MKPIEVTKANFEAEVLKSDKPVLVDFWATWCGPCKMLSPVIDEIAESCDSVKFCKVNADDEDELCAQFGIMSIPCLILFKDGKAEKQNVGFMPKDGVLEFIGA